jgi:hypothetical protein
MFALGRAQIVAARSRLAGLREERAAIRRL